MSPRPWALLAVLLPACASSGPRKEPAPEEISVVRHVDRATPPAPEPVLAGARCRNATAAGCLCREPGEDTETEPPAAGQKRLEIRLSADAGEATLQSPTLGRFNATGAREACFYVDVPAGSKHAFTLHGSAGKPADGFTPRFRLAEYGPRGPHWYQILAVECVGSGGRCDRAGADTWVASLQSRKRGRLDPCGSLVVTGLRWETSGGAAARDGGLYRDFTASFDLEVKKFETQFAPGSTECVPK